jgi:hypothetical protein
MNVIQPVQKLLDDLLDFAEGELNVDIGQQPSQVVITEIEHQVEGAPVFVVVISLRPADLEQVDNVFVLEQLEDFNFSQCSNRETFLFVVHQYFL